MGDTPSVVSRLLRTLLFQKYGQLFEETVEIALPLERPLMRTDTINFFVNYKINLCNQYLYSVWKHCIHYSFKPCEQCDVLLAWVVVIARQQIREVFMKDIF